MVHVAVCWASILYDSQTYGVTGIDIPLAGSCLLRSRLFPQFRNEGKRHPELCAVQPSSLQHECVELVSGQALHWTANLRSPMCAH